MTDRETVEEFLARNGKIDVIPMGMTRRDPITGLPKREHDRVIKSAKIGNLKRKKAVKQPLTEDETDE